MMLDFIKNLFKKDRDMQKWLDGRRRESKEYFDSEIIHWLPGDLLIINTSCKLIDITSDGSIFVNTGHFYTEHDGQIIRLHDIDSILRAINNKVKIRFRQTSDEIKKFSIETDIIVENNSFNLRRQMEKVYEKIEQEENKRKQEQEKFRAEIKRNGVHTSSLM